jgi:hypothetical protein
MSQLSQAATAEFQQAMALPQAVLLNFDVAYEESVVDGATAGSVFKTSHRTVVSLRLGTFQAREIVRYQDGERPRRSAQLADMVPPGARYGFDLIAHVGIESLLHGQSLDEIRKDLAGRPVPIDIPISTLWDQQRKFLFYLGHLHQQATGLIGRYLAEQGDTTWLLDGTVECGTPVFLGIEDAASGMILAGRKVPSENVDDIASCLREVGERYGQPTRVLHDLSGAMSGACDLALPGVAHFVCHYHLCRDVGGDLYESPQSDLMKRLRSLKVLARLHDQRKGQTQFLRAATASEAEFVLTELLAGRAVQASFSATLGREVLLALHYWILDHRADGSRRGFPFDPYTLYLHRRLVRAGEAVDRLMARTALAQQAPPALVNFQNLLREYRTDAQIVAASRLYERAFAMFDRLRAVLRLTPEHMDHQRQPHDLPSSEQQELKTALDQLRDELRAQSQDQSHADHGLAKIVLTHLDKYWAHLVPDEPNAAGASWKRTTNQLERHWGGMKRVRRRAHGRGKLVRDFLSLPEEYLLVPNLENPIYVELVLGGSLESLPVRLAEASRDAGTFAAWNRSGRPCRVGQLSHRLLRRDDFIDDLITVCHRHCGTAPPEVA